MIEKIKPYINYAVLAISVILLILLCRGYLHHDGKRIGEVRNQLDEAGRNQQTISAGIAGSQERACEVRGEIETARNRISRLEEQEQSAGSIIADCQQILKDVRRRGKTQAANN